MTAALHRTALHRAQAAPITPDSRTARTLLALWRDDVTVEITAEQLHAEPRLVRDVAANLSARLKTEVVIDGTSEFCEAAIDGARNLTGVTVSPSVAARQAKFFITHHTATVGDWHAPRWSCEPPWQHWLDMDYRGRICSAALSAAPRPGLEETTLAVLETESGGAWLAMHSRPQLTRPRDVPLDVLLAGTVTH